VRAFQTLASAFQRHRNTEDGRRERAEILAGAAIHRQQRSRTGHDAGATERICPVSRPRTVSSTARGARPLPLASIHPARLVLAAMQQRQQEAALREVRERRPHHARELRHRLTRARDGRLELRTQQIDSVEHQRREERVLAPEIPVERPLPDTADARHVVHAHFVEVLAQEDGLGAAQDPLAHPDGRRAPPPRGGVHFDGLAWLEGAA
jgi:hypothetical protein